MIDSEGFRANVGIVLSNERGQVFWARRAWDDDAWQFPQGGIEEGEDPEVAMYRELKEEIGLLPEHVEIIARTDDWLRYWLPDQYIRSNSHPVCIGQKQRWFLLKLLVDESHVKLDNSNNPEFDYWCWVDYWAPVNQVIAFKRDVYEEALRQLADYLFSQS